MKIKAIAERRRKLGRGKRAYTLGSVPKLQERNDDTDNDSNVTNTYAVEQIEQVAGIGILQFTKMSAMVRRNIRGYWSEKKKGQSEAREGNEVIFDVRLTAQDSGNNNVQQDSSADRNNNFIRNQPKDMVLSPSSRITPIDNHSDSIPQRPIKYIPVEPAEVLHGNNEVQVSHSIPQIYEIKTKEKPCVTDNQKTPKQPKFRQLNEFRTTSKQIRPARGAKVSNTNAIAQKYAERGKAHFKRNAQAHMVWKNSKTTVIFQKIGCTVSGTLKSLGRWLTGLIGGVGMVMIFGTVLLFGAVIASPLGILFSNESSPGSVPLSAAVAQINMELNAQLSNLQNSDYSSIEITGAPPDWVEVIAVFASHTAGAEDGMDVAVLDAQRVERLRNTFWDMCSISTFVERIEQPTTDETAPIQPPEVILHIRISAKSAEEMRTEYSFTEFQNEALDLLLTERIRVLSMVGNLTVSQENAIAVLEALPATLSQERRAVVQQALSLVGKVNYFWGGKSLVIGWDNRWGKLTKVTAPGSRTTGTIRPYGLDCSGFVDWVFYNVSGGDYVIGHGGGAGSQHRYCTNISWSEAQPGDLVFYYNDDHIGIVGGWDEQGNLLIIHCASGQNNVVITGKSGFIAIAVPEYYGE